MSSRSRAGQRGGEFLFSAWQDVSPQVEICFLIAAIRKQLTGAVWNFSC
jgi:hypothetical protein